jgi:ABC-type transport system involved in cytochrome bd biosynthesis fused ATPase/permease subunit
VETADRIIVMEAGHIVEDGVHSELLTARGPYAQLYHAQLVAQVRATSTAATARPGTPAG